MGSRPVLKKELELLKAQAEVFDSFGRARSRKSEDWLVSDGDGEGWRRKKRKVNDDVEKGKENVEGGSIGLGKVESNLEGSKSPNKFLSALNEEEGKGDSFSPPSVKGPEGKVLIENEERSNLGECMSKDELKRRFTPSALKCMVLPDGLEATRVVEGVQVENPAVVKEGIVAENSLISTPVRRFTRSALKCLVPDGNEMKDVLVDKPLKQSDNLNSKLKAESPVRNMDRELQNTSPSGEREPHTNCEGRGIREEEANVGITNLKKYDNEGVKSACMKKPEVQVTRFTSKNGPTPSVPEEEQSESMKKTSAQLSCLVSESKIESIPTDDKIVQNDSAEKSPGEKAKLQVEDGKIHDASEERHLRRCTRSVLREKAELLDVRLPDTSSGGSTISEDVCENGTTARSHEETTEVTSEIKVSKKSLKMKKYKMTGYRALLETGMLEGLSVKYVLKGRKNEGLQGIIKGCGILCSCTLCKGCEVIELGKFERHAGSTNRNPAYYTLLDNGKSLSDVLNAYKSAPFEVTIQNAISLSPVDSGICLMCKRAIQISSTMRKVSLCNSCLESQESLASPACSASMASRSLRAVAALKSSGSGVKCLSKKRQISQKKLKSSKLILTPKSSGSVLKHISKKSQSGQTKLGSSKLILTPKSSDSISNSISGQNPSRRGRLTIKDLRLHKLVFEENALPDGAELVYCAEGKRKLLGFKKGFGILCSCCKEVLSASQFETHAGYQQRRKPYLHIFTSNGVSLHELSLSLSKERKFSANDNDDLCTICAGFGDLLLCDGCPRAFHKDCVGQVDVPNDNWYCPYCQNMFQKEKSCANNANAKAAGRVSGVDPIEQISKQCIRIAKTPENEFGGCTLCRSPVFSKSGFRPLTIIICDQCEKEYHVGCLQTRGIADLKELPAGKWFCSSDCTRIHSALQKLVEKGPEKLPEAILKVIKKKNEENSSSNDIDISWRLLCGKTACAESRSLLSKSVAIFHDSFAPIEDSVTHRDLIPIMVYGKKIRQQDFEGMFCAVLTVNSYVVSAGILRVLGKEFAELPLVATSNGYQGQGFFQSLFNCIEKLLGFLNVENLVLPAAEEAVAIWTNKFGFQKMSDDQLSKCRKDYQFTIFQGTTMLYKPILKCRLVNKSS